jgi:antitoxin HicB
MTHYPVILTKDGPDVMATFPGFPGVTYGSNEAEALLRSRDALETVLMAMIQDRKPIPRPRPRGGCWVMLPGLSEAKVELYRQMHAKNVGKAELARRLHCQLPQIERLLDLSHASRLEQVEEALLAVGKRLTVSVETASKTAGRIARHRGPSRPRGRGSRGRRPAKAAATLPA